MAGKQKHLLERDGRFFARMVVPVEVRKIIGKTELREPLGADRRTAQRRLNAAIARFQDQIDAAREQIGASLPHQHRALTVAEIASTHYAEELALDEGLRNLTHDDGEPVLDGSYEAIFRAGHEKALRRVAGGTASNEEMAALVGWAIDRFQARGNTATRFGTPEWRELARALAAAQLEAIDGWSARDDGRPAPEPAHPLLELPADPRPKLALGRLFDGYIAELKASGRGQEAERRWKPVFADLARFLGHDDARRIVKTDIARWKDELIQTKAAKTVRDVYVASVRTVLQWAVDNGRLDVNPAAGMKVRVTKRTLGREKGFTLEEAKALLQIARDYIPPSAKTVQTREKPFMTAAKRWVPWLCAHTGARVSEMTQLRKEDVRTDNGVTYVRITPDAGSVKTGEYRDVPLHPEIITLGFLDFVAASAPGPLFYKLNPNRKGRTHPSKHVAGRLSGWVRTLKIIPAEIDPNHAWRHRLKTVGREIGIDPRVLDAIQGHAARTAGEDYGDVTLKAKNRTILSFPSYLIGASD